MTADGSEAARPHWEDVVAAEAGTREASAARAGTRLTVRQLLDFEARVLSNDPAREQKIRTELDVTPGRFQQLLNAALDTREALEYNPILVGHLRLRRELNRGIRARRCDEPAGDR